MNPNNLQELQQGQPQDPSQAGGQGGNPFDSIVQQFASRFAGQGQQPSQPQGQPSALSQASQASQPDSEGAQEQAVPADAGEDQTQQGVNPGTSKFLVGAIQQLQNFIAESQDKDEIAVGRSVIQLLSRLIQQDQANQSAKL